MMEKHGTDIVRVTRGVQGSLAAGATRFSGGSCEAPYGPHQVKKHQTRTARTGVTYPTSGASANATIGQIAESISLFQIGPTQTYCWTGTEVSDKQNAKKKPEYASWSLPGFGHVVWCLGPLQQVQVLFIYKLRIRLARLQERAA